MCGFFMRFIEYCAFPSVDVLPKRYASPAFTTAGDISLRYLSGSPFFALSGLPCILCS